MKHETVKQDMISMIKIVIGCFLYSLSVVLFIDPVSIIPGSVTGIGVVVKALTGFPIGALNLLVNIPLVIVGTIILGKRLLIFTGVTVLLTSVMMDGLAFLTPFTEDILLASVFGGIVMGVGLGLILDGGGTTGGTTVVGRLVNRKKPDMPMGDILMIGDFIIIMMGSILMKNWDLMLYSLIDLYVCVVFINLVMYGGKTQTVSVIRTEQAAAIKEKIQSGRYGKILDQDEKQVILVSWKKNLGKVQRIVEQVDAKASCVALHTDHSYGDMYREMRKKHS